jgi:hypothetical protein
LYWYSAGSNANTATPGSNDTASKPRVSMMGGGGSLPAAISRKKASPSTCRADAAEIAGSPHW